MPRNWPNRRGKAWRQQPAPTGRTRWHDARGITGAWQLLRLTSPFEKPTHRVDEHLQGRYRREREERIPTRSHRQRNPFHSSAPHAVSKIEAVDQRIAGECDD